MWLHNPAKGCIKGERNAATWLNSWSWLTEPHASVSCVQYMYLSVGKKTTYFFSSQEFRYYYSMAILHRTVYLPVAPCRWFFFIIAATWCVLVVVYMSMFTLECHATWHDSQGKRHSVRSERSRWRNSFLVLCSLPPTRFDACYAGYVLCSEAARKRLLRGLGAARSINKWTQKALRLLPVGIPIKIAIIEK